MTKAEEIRSLYAQGITSTRTIGDLVHCGTPYVRVVLRQRINGKISKADKNYRDKQTLKRQAKRKEQPHGRDSRAHS